MFTFNQITPLQEQLLEWRNRNQKIVLVPTMGNLHAGHLSLVDKAKQCADKTIVSIFVNPTQFVQGEDYSTYPRTLEQDVDKLTEFKIDALFCPDSEIIYPGQLQMHTCVMVPELDNILCGKFRPGHFTGVATVVAKLFNIIKPDIAIFGEKDYQQFLIIKRLARDLFFRIEIISMPTIREADGLAMSSRNKYLNVKERKIAPLLFQTLNQIADKIIAGDHAFLQHQEYASWCLNKAGFQTEYVSICDAETLKKPATGDLVVLAAVCLGKARLIDNLLIKR
jgi:pantoate--beta-alanine ligase